MRERETEMYAGVDTEGGIKCRRFVSGGERKHLRERRCACGAATAQFMAGGDGRREGGSGEEGSGEEDSGASLLRLERERECSGGDCFFVRLELQEKKFLGPLDPRGN